MKTHLAANSESNHFVEADHLAVAAIKGIAMDAPALAKSGHSGTAMALAPLAHVLWSRIMAHDPSDPNWWNRDRFILSCGHASVLQYTMVHLCGYALSIDDLTRFRSAGSNTPGHPERHCAPTVEVTTGPLGQGFANAVGMAWSERNIRARFGSDITDHYIYVLCGDGDLQEGISHEAASFAGHQGLDHLIAIYDDNKITIDGATDIAASENVCQRFQAYGWNVICLENSAEDLQTLQSTLLQAKDNVGSPTLIVLKTVIGFPSPNLAGTAKAHGPEFPAEEINLTKQVLKLDPQRTFVVDESVYKLYQDRMLVNKSIRARWKSQAATSACWSDFQSLHNEEFHGTQSESNQKFESLDFAKSMATRAAAHTALNLFAANTYRIVVGSADLTGNTGVGVEGFELSSKNNPAGRAIPFGIREHAMGAIANGIAAHGPLLPIVSTFLVFADYMRPSIRLASMSKLNVLFWFSHDSIGVGEDGPTHQPVEQIMSLRLIPGLELHRPADLAESIGSLAACISSDRASVLISSRQTVRAINKPEISIAGATRGAYVVDADPDAQLTLVSCGSELSTCNETLRVLRENGIRVKLVSLPCWQLFDELTVEQKLEILSGMFKVAVEAGVTTGWEKYVDHVIGINTFGLSAPGHIVMDHFGLSTTRLIDEILKIWQQDTR